MRLILTVALICLALGAPAAEDPFLAALARSPAIVAAHARVEAARRSAGAAGVLPDPMLTADLGRKRQRMGDDMTMYGAMLGQSLPRWGERDAMRQQAAARIELAEADFAEAAGEHAASVSLAAAEASAASATATLLTETTTRVRAMREAVVARLGAGNAMLGEALTLDTRLQNLELQLAVQRQRQDDADAEAHGRLGLPIGQPLPEVTYPDPAGIDPAKVPMARRAHAMRGEARAMEREASARGNPETALGLRWEREAASTPEQSDTYSLALTISLPVWRQAYADAADGARASARAAGHEAAASTWMARSALARAKRAAAIANQARTTAEAVAGRARSDYDAVIRQVGTGAATLGTALGLLDMVSEAQLQAIEAELSAKMALAELWRLAPPDLTGGMGVSPVLDHVDHGQDAHATPSKALP